MKRFLALAAVAALSGCATQAPLQNAADLRHSHGYVVAALPPVASSLGSGPSALSPFAGAQGFTVTLRSLKDGSEVPLDSTGDRALARWVPAGTYEIAEMVGKEKGTVSPIEVSAGRATDLGGLTWASVGANQRVLLPLRHPEIAERTSSVVQQAKEHLPAGVIEWSPPVTPPPQDIPAASINAGLIGDLMMVAAQKANQAPLRDRLRAATDLKEFTALYASSAAPLIGDSATDAHGNLYIGSNFGMLRKRDTRGEWSSIDTGTIAAVTAVHANEQAIVIGTQDGRLRTSVDRGRTWSALHRFSDRESVQSIHHVAGRYLIVTGQTADARERQPGITGASVYEMRSASSERPNLIRKLDFASRVVPFLASSITGVVADRFFYLNSISGVDRLDLTNGTWTTVKVPHEVHYLRSSSDGKLLTGFKEQGLFSKLSISSDYGATWLPLNTPPYHVQDVRMETSTSGAGLRWDSGLFAAALQWITYDDQTKSWTPVWTAPPASCVRAVRDSSGAAQLCVSSGGSIFRLTPQGLVPEFLAQ